MLRKTYPDRWLPDREERAASITHTFLAVGRERYDRVAASLGIEPRDPFMDLRVIYFCLSLPFDKIAFDGRPKALLRQAMAGMVPDSIRDRVSKEHLGWAFSEAMLKRSTTDWHVRVIQKSVEIERYIRREAIASDGMASGHELNLQLFKLWSLLAWLPKQVAMATVDAISLE